jgi:hypothetical protein
LEDGNLKGGEDLRTHNSVHKGLTLGLLGKERGDGGAEERKTHHDVKVEG